MKKLQEKKKKTLGEILFSILTIYPGPHIDSALTG